MSGIVNAATSEPLCQKWIPFALLAEEGGGRSVSSKSHNSIIHVRSNEIRNECVRVEREDGASGRPIQQVSNGPNW